MKWIEKIRQMDADELAKFICDCDSYDGFMDKACSRCPYRPKGGECISDNLYKDSVIAVKELLESEVPSDEEA